MTKIVNFAEVAANFDLAPTEAIAVFIDKGIKPSFAWQDMLGAEHDQAFTVAKMMDADLLLTVKAKFEKALAEGTTLADFKKQLIPELQAAGWWGKKDVIDPLTGLVQKAQLGSASRLETIFRSNIQSAYATGQWDSITRTAKAMPYLLYDAVDDHRTRPEHAARDGEVHPVNSDFWKSHYPPNGWNCRCGVIQLDDDDIEGMGLTVTKAPDIKTRKWVNPRTGVVMDVPIDTDPGWDHNPGLARQKKLLQAADDKASKMLTAERAAYKAAMAKRAVLAARYKKQLDQNQALQALLKPAEEAKLAIAKALKDNTPYLANEIKKLQSAKPDMDPVAMIATAHEKALKSEQNSLTQAWKQAMLKGKEPSEKSKAFVATLPEDKMLALQADIDAKTGTTAAKAELGAIAAGEAKVQTKLKQKILEKWSKDGTAAKFANDPKGLVAAIAKESAEQQSKAEQASALSGYKKKVLDGKIPTPKQQQVFNSLDDTAKAKVLADIDAKKPAPPAAPPPPAPKPKPAPAAAPAPQAVVPKDYDDLSDADKYKTAYYATGADEAGFPDPDLFLEESVSGQKAYIKELESMADDFADDDGGGKALLQGFVNQAAKDGDAWAIKSRGAPAPGPAPAPAPAAAVAPDGKAPDADKLIQIGPQKGSNKGGLFQDPDTGQKWYIKQPNSAEIARNEVLAGKLYEAAGIEVPELHLVDWGGKPSIASKIIDGVDKDRALLTGDKEVPGVADGFMTDAWLANWDVVGMEFDNLLVKAGRAIRVDTGGALRFRAQGTKKGADFGDTVLELQSLRDGTASQTTAVFGKLSKEQLTASARRVVSITDDQIDDLVGQFGPTSKAERSKLAATLKARRDHIAREYPEATAKPTPAPAPSKEKVTRLEQENIANSRSNGYSIATDKDQIEDQSVLVWHKTTAKGEAATSGYLKIRGEAEEALRSKLGTASGPPDYNDLHNQVVAAVISVRSRVASGQAFSAGAMEKITGAVNRFDAITKAMRAEINAGLRDASTLADLEAKALPFISQLRQVASDGIGAKPKWNDVGNYATFEIPKARPAKAAAGELSWQKGRTRYNLAQLERGHAQEQNDLFDVRSDIFETTIDGVKVKFWPDQAGVPWALRGRVEIQAPGKDQASAARIFETLEKLGVNADRATDVDIESLYLRQIAYANKLDTKAPFKNALAKGDTAKAKTWLSEQLGVDLDKSPHYRPQGERQAFEHGRRARYRPELLSDPKWGEFERDYRLHHSITNSSMLDALKNIINGGGQMAPSTDKMRRGIKLGGMSPDQDLETGGANYFFTRIKRGESAHRDPGIVWKARPAARVDSISYDGDKYGRTTGSYVKNNRKASIDDMKEAAQNGGNETIIKDSLSLFDDLDRIVARDESERDAIIQLFKRAGYTEWPDGRSLEEVILLRGSR